MKWMEEGDNFVLDDHGTNHVSITPAGAVTFNGAVSGVANLTATGDAAITGKVTTEGIHFSSSTYVADGAIDADDTFVLLDASSASTDMTIAAPAAGRFLVITCVSAANSCTVTCSAGDFDGTNHIATFDAAEETLVLFGVSSTRFVIVENIGAVALSAA